MSSSQVLIYLWLSLLPDQKLCELFARATPYLRLYRSRRHRVIYRLYGRRSQISHFRGERNRRRHHRQRRRCGRPALPAVRPAVFLKPTPLLPHCYVGTRKSETEIIRDHYDLLQAESPVGLALMRSMTKSECCFPCGLEKEIL